VFRLKLSEVHKVRAAGPLNVCAVAFPPLRIPLGAGAAPLPGPPGPAPFLPSTSPIPCPTAPARLAPAANRNGPSAPAQTQAATLAPARGTNGDASAGGLCAAGRAALDGVCRSLYSDTSRYPRGPGRTRPNGTSAGSTPPSRRGRHNARQSGTTAAAANGIPRTTAPPRSA